MYQSAWKAKVLIIGCGNTLFGDDGFGPAVIEYLNREYRMPDGVIALDAGTAAGEILLDALLGEQAPRTLILVDAMDFGLDPGIVEEIPLEQLPENKRADFSVHQFPVNILKELRERRGTSVRLLGCQIESLPEEIHQGLSAAVAHAVGKTAGKIFQIVREEVKS